MITLKLVGSSPASNPDTLLVEATFSGDYGVNGVGDLMDFTAISDPKLLGRLALLNLTPDTPIQVLSQNIGGYDVQPTFPAAPTLKNFGLRMYLAGVEILTGVAYNAAVTAAGRFVLLGIRPPQQEG
jgi:hypothetical protein